MLRMEKTMSDIVKFTESDGGRCLLCCSEYKVKTIHIQRRVSNFSGFQLISFDICSNCRSELVAKTKESL